jgi:hypothetical protein
MDIPQRRLFAAFGYEFGLATPQMLIPPQLSRRRV